MEATTNSGGDPRKETEMAATRKLPGINPVHGEDQGNGAELGDRTGRSGARCGRELSGAEPWLRLGEEEELEGEGEKRSGGAPEVHNDDLIPPGDCSGPASEVVREGRLAGDVFDRVRARARPSGGTARRG